MSTSQTPERTKRESRDVRLDAYRERADPVMAIISAFYLVLLLIPRIAITSYDSSIAILALDVIFWTIITADIAYRLWLTTERRGRRTLWVALILLLTGPFVFLAITPDARFLIRIALISVVALRASNSIRFFFRLRSIIYIVAAVILITVVFGVLITATERDAPRSNITSLSSGIWWSLETISTVGYGDTYPVTDTGRIIATGLMFFGVAMFSILTATLANAFANRAVANTTDRLSDIQMRLDRIEHSQQGATPARRTRAPQRPPRRTSPPRAGGTPIEEG